VDLLISVLVSQGRIADAEKLAHEAIRLLDNSGILPQTYFYARARMALGHVLASRADFPTALGQFDQAKEYLQREPFEAERYSQRNLSMVLSLVMSGRHDEALPWISDALEGYSSRFGGTHYITAEVLALKGLAEARMGRRREALDSFVRSIPVLTKHVAEDLSNRRVLVFATHALVPGDLDGLDQPALALSSPSVTGEKEDGLLTLTEVLKLKLNADWIVLSACNTGAAEGEGSEAVSGLGRAFFYAGTRALLVSMWPVETTSARMLTTGLFRHQQEDRNLPRSEALRRTLLDLIDQEVLKDPETGKIVAAYAHPFFWASFIVVGESARRN